MLSVVDPVVELDVVDPEVELDVVDPEVELEVVGEPEVEVDVEVVGEPEVEVDVEVVGEPEVELEEVVDPEVEPEVELDLVEDEDEVELEVEELDDDEEVEVELVVGHFAIVTFQRHSVFLATCTPVASVSTGSGQPINCPAVRATVSISVLNGELSQGGGGGINHLTNIGIGSPGFILEVLRGGTSVTDGISGSFHTTVSRVIPTDTDCSLRSSTSI